MTTGISAIDHAEQMGRMKAPTLTYGYYRQPNGWITVSPVTAMEELKYRREGWEPLTQYGRVEMATEYAADHPLETLFMRGGAGELGREQIVEMALHLNPPLVPVCGQTLSQNHKRHSALCWKDAQPVAFPQLGDDVPEGVACRFCSRDPFPSEVARDQHEQVSHKQEQSELRSGKALAEAMITGFNGSQTPSTNPYLCGSCGEGFDNHVRLAQHFKDEHAGS